MSKLFGKRPSSDFEPSELTKKSGAIGLANIKLGDQIIDASVPAIVDYVSGTQYYQKIGERVVSADLAQMQDMMPIRSPKDVLQHEYGSPLQSSMNARMGAKIDGLAQQKDDQLTAAGLTQKISTQGTRGLTQLGRMQDDTKFRTALNRGQAGAAYGNLLGTLGGIYAYKKNNP
tara:strand:- start:190 stop:711 length:522 start_codon:yes stop_codon:yes gene_type:complete